MTSVWIVAGIIGGAIAGLVDAGIAIAGGIGGMSVGKAIRLVTLSASLLAAAGGLGGLLIAAGDALVRRTRHPARWAGVLWTLACGAARASTTRSRCSPARARRASRRTGSSPPA